MLLEHIECSVYLFAGTQGCPALAEHGADWLSVGNIASLDML
jgi:hypothetical protein